MKTLTWFSQPHIGCGWGNPPYWATVQHCILTVGRIHWPPLHVIADYTDQVGTIWQAGCIEVDLCTSSLPIHGFKFRRFLMNFNPCMAVLREHQDTRQHFLTSSSYSAFFFCFSREEEVHKNPLQPDHLQLTVVSYG